MDKEELVKKLSKAGIHGEWVRPNRYGFSRVFQFHIEGQLIEIEWYQNYSTLIIGNAHFFFDQINLNSSYPHVGRCIDFSFRGEHSLHLCGLGHQKSRNFLNELEALCIKYNLSISHEDSQGAFIIEDYNDYNMNWLRDAIVKIKEGE